MFELTYAKLVKYRKKITFFLFGSIYRRAPANYGIFTSLPRQRQTNANELRITTRS